MFITFTFPNKLFSYTQYKFCMQRQISISNRTNHELKYQNFQTVIQNTKHKHGSKLLIKLQSVRWFWAVGKEIRQMQSQIYDTANQLYAHYKVYLTQCMFLTQKGIQRFLGYFCSIFLGTFNRFVFYVNMYSIVNFFAHSSSYFLNIICI